MTTRLNVDPSHIDGLHENQARAVELAATEGVLIVTGGPGTGKTHTTNRILDMFEANNLRVMCAAPTGKAAQRMKELTGRDATTIHRMLGWTPSGWRFDADEPRKSDADGNPIAGPLHTDVVVIDETSMVDHQLFAGVVQAMLPSQRLILIGDVNQLPSIGKGRVLHDLIQSGVVPQVTLTKIFRQADESAIPFVARDVNEGVCPDTTKLNKASGSPDVAWVDAPEVNDLQRAVVDAVVRLIPQQRGIPSEDIQVLCPQNKKAIGIETLNDLLQRELNPNFRDDKRLGLRAGRGYRLFSGDRVIHAHKNDYGIMVANGEVGRLLDQNWKGVAVPAETTQSGRGTPVAVVDFGDRKVAYTKQEAENLELAYAITIHKSQGSQFPCVVVPVHSLNRFSLTRPLVYTAITRAERLLVMLGEPDSLATACNNTRGTERRTSLQERLQGEDN